MADLLQYLVSQSSQESFHSTQETVEAAGHKHNLSPAHDQRSPSPAPTPTPKTKQDDTTIAALQAAGLNVHDVNTFLTDPENAALLASAKKRKGNASTTTNPTPSISTIAAMPTPEPVQLGSPKTSHNVTHLMHLCQERGLLPVYEFAEPTAQRFSASLQIGASVVTLGGEGELTFGSKREAKEAIAAKGLEVLKDMPVPGSGPNGGAAAGVEENWVGRLAEFHTADGPIYIDYALGTNFACECTIPRRSDAAFGARTLPFPNKKAAKTNAAREAVLWLVENGDMSRTAEGGYVNNSNGGKRKKGKSGVGMAIVAAESGEGAAQRGAGVGGERKEVSFVARVIDLCTTLGLPSPEYQLVQSPQAPSMYSGAAHFVHNPLLNNNAPVGEIRLVFGRKNAREACAEKVLAFLRGVLREREGVLVDL